jgi:hypothetical protein
LWFKIITSTTQTDNAEENNRRERKGASTSDHKTRKASHIHQPTKKKTPDTTDTGLWKGREFGAVHVLLKTKNKKQKEKKEKKKNSTTQNANWGRALASVLGCITQIAFLGTLCGTKLEKQTTCT